jgi:hypothetical protein
VVGTLEIGSQRTDMVRYSVFPPVVGFSGDLDYTALYAGESCSLVRDIRPAGRIVKDVVQDAERAVEAMTAA